MGFFGGWFKGLGALVLSVLAFGLFSSQAVPTASFTMTPNGNPVVGQTVQFADTSTGNPTSWSWNFGDGQSSTLQSPTHVYLGPGSFNATLTASNAEGSNSSVQPVFVSTNDTLRLNLKGNHAFTVKLQATDQRTGRTGPGQAIPQNDLFGYFSLPSLTSNPDNPEVFVKILDGTTINGQFWVFYGHLTDLIYDITVTEVATGFVKTYHKDAGNSAGGFDTSGFHATATPTATPPATATPTPTPTALSLITVNLAASNFQWDFTGGGPSFTFRVGQPYQVRVSRTNGTHTFSGVSALGWPATSFPTSQPVLVINFTPTAAKIGTFGFACTQPSCGIGHSDMLNGQVIVAP